MSTELTKLPDEGLERLTRLDERVRELHRQAKSVNTRRAYHHDWKGFSAWCEQMACSVLPALPETVARFVAARGETHRISSIGRSLAAIAQIHRAAKLDDPTKTAVVREAFKGLRREKGVSPARKTAATTEVIRRMLATLADSKIGTRDRALLLIGFAGGLRRSELVALEVADLEFTDDGLLVTIRKSKTDQESAGRVIGIAYGSNPDTCPVRKLRIWLAAGGLTQGPVFRGVTRHGKISSTRLTDQVVAKIVKRCALKAGFDPRVFAGHSLRSGFVTEAAENDVSDRQIMAQTGHKTRTMVDRYIQQASIFRDNASTKLGL